jgi:hypothetical protein
MQFVSGTNVQFVSTCPGSRQIGKVPRVKINFGDLCVNQAFVGFQYNSD